LLDSRCSAKNSVETHPEIAILTQLQTQIKVKLEKGVGRPFPRVPNQLHAWLDYQKPTIFVKANKNVA